MTDRMNFAGQVVPGYVNLSNGVYQPWPARHNTISYEATFAMAMAYGGDMTYVPNRIGIIYGPANVTFGLIDRDQTWSDLLLDLESKACDVQVSTFSYAPSVRRLQDDSSSADTGSVVTFHAHSTGSNGELGLPFATGKSIYQAVLLNRTYDATRILARVSLLNGTTAQTKPDGFEVALDWNIKFL